MTHDERQAAHKAIFFPKDRFGSRAIESPARSPGTVRRGLGPFPTVGNMGESVPWCRLEDGYLYDPFDMVGSLPSTDGTWSDDGEVPRVDVDRRARSLVGYLRNFGVNGITHSDIAAECEGEWGRDYAIVCDAFTPWGEGTDSEYFDEDRCVQDFMRAVREFFACDPTVDVRFHNLQHGSNEVEFVRERK